MRRLLQAGLVAWLLAVLPAQELQTLHLTVTSVSGRSVYFDKGRADGVVPGAVVRLLPPGMAPLEVEVLVASSSSSRGDVPSGLPMPPVGTPGTAEVAPPTPAPPPPEQPPAVAHPPWTRSEEGRQAGQPLLVPAYGQRPDRRPTEVHGRVYTNEQWNVDRTGDAAGDYWLARLGTTLEVTNPFGAGGRARFAGEIEQRFVHLGAGADDTDTQGRVDLLSYAHGTEAFAPLRYEIGRFYSEALPELGLLDGVEALGQFDGGFRLGAGIGSYPLPFATRDSGDDLGGHVVFDYALPGSRAFACAVGYQKTWHQGTPDRDLLLLRLEGRLQGGWSWFSSAKVDFYTGRDTIKSSSVELTEFIAQARRDGSIAGTGLGVSLFRWPELLREEYRDLSVELVRDGHVERVGWSGWWRPLEDLRLSGRVDRWWDQDKDGTAGEVSMDWSNALRSGTSVYAALTLDDGSFSSGPGVRVRLRRAFHDLFVDCGWAMNHVEFDSGVGGASTRHTVDVGVDWNVGAFDVNLTLQQWFGDENGTSIGFYGQVRF